MIVRPLLWAYKGPNISIEFSEVNKKMGFFLGLSIIAGRPFSNPCMQAYANGSRREWGEATLPTFPPSCYDPKELDE